MRTNTCKFFNTGFKSCNAQYSNSLKKKENHWN